MKFIVGMVIINWKVWFVPDFDFEKLEARYDCTTSSSSSQGMEWTKNLKLAWTNYYSGVVDDVNINSPFHIKQ